MTTRVVVEVSNLTIHRTQFIRTGIQEVVYQTLRSLVRLRPQLKDIELILLPFMPRKIDGVTLLPFANTPIEVLKQIESELGMSSPSVWGFDLQARNYALSDAEIYEFLENADVIHVQSMIHVAPIAELLAKKAGKSPRFSMTAYDLVPALFPEFCDDQIAEWWNTTYLPGLGKCIEQALCISRSTAIDFSENSQTNAIPQIQVLPLPVQIHSKDGSANADLGLRKGEYLVFLGSLEPRKNIDSLLSGFEFYKSTHPHSPLKLVLVGGTGWKNAVLEKNLRRSPVAKDIVRTGYLDDVPLEGVMRNALAVTMISFYEGFGLPIAQASALGTQVITTLGSSLPEACAADAIFVDPMDPLSISAGIQIAVSRQKRPASENRVPTRTWDGYGKALIDAVLNQKVRPTF